MEQHPIHDDENKTLVSPLDELAEDLAEKEQEVPPLQVNRSSKRKRMIHRSAGSYDESRPVIGQKAKEIRDERQDQATTIATFKTALRNPNTILEGTIAGAEIIGSDTFWVLYENQVTILIPLTEAYQVIPQSLLASRDPRTLRSQRAFLDAAIGGKINYCVTKFEADPERGYVVTGSRIKAMKLIQRRYFGENAPYKLYVGANVVCRVLTVGSVSIYVDVCGLDVKVRNFDITFRYVDDASKMFRPGNTLTLQVKDISYSPDGEPIIALDGKPVELEIAKKYRSRIRRGGVYLATVTSMHKENRNGNIPSVVVNLYLDSANFPAYSRDVPLLDMSSLRTGSKVKFEAHGISDDGYVYGRIDPRSIQQLN